jgi:hypothetical protein
MMRSSRSMADGNVDRPITADAAVEIYGSHQSIKESAVDSRRQAIDYQAPGSRTIASPCPDLVGRRKMI